MVIYHGTKIKFFLRLIINDGPDNTSSDITKQIRKSTTEMPSRGESDQPTVVWSPMNQGNVASCSYGQHASLPHHTQQNSSDYTSRINSYTTFFLLPNNEQRTTGHLTQGKPYWQYIVQFYDYNGSSNQL
jgi:hypothetical protein